VQIRRAPQNSSQAEISRFSDVSDPHPLLTCVTTMDLFNTPTMSIELAVFFLVLVGFLVAVRRLVDYRAAVVGIQYVSFTLLHYGLQYVN
jgi:hypothetical protein